MSPLGKTPCDTYVLQRAWTKEAYGASGPPALSTALAKQPNTSHGSASRTAIWTIVS